MANCYSLYMLPLQCTSENAYIICCWMSGPIHCVPIQGGWTRITRDISPSNECWAWMDLKTTERGHSWENSKQSWQNVFQTAEFGNLLQEKFTLVFPFSMRLTKKQQLCKTTKTMHMSFFWRVKRKHRLQKKKRPPFLGLENGGLSMTRTFLNGGFSTRGGEWIPCLAGFVWNVFFFMNEKSRY